MNNILATVGTWADWWMANLLRATWQGALVIAVVWVMARRFPLLSPRVVCWLWRLACLKLLVALVWSSPVSLPLLPPDERALEPAHVAGTSAATPGANGVGRLSTPHAAAQDATRDQRLTWAVAANMILLSMWLAGVALVFVVAARQWRAARRLLARSVPASDRTLRSWFQQQARTIGVRRVPELRTSRGAFCPALVGLMRPAILFPDDVLAAFNADEIALIAAHELAHHRRHDLAWNYLLLAVRALFFFHPLVWLLARGWEEAQESACDALVLEQGTARSSEYGRLLLALATRPTARQRPSFAVAGVFGSCGNLERRVLAMTHFRTLSRHRLAALLSLIACSGIAVVVPWRLVAQESKPPAPTDKAAAQAPPHSFIAQRTSINNLKLILLAMHNYASRHDGFPPAYTSKDGKPLLSWRVAVLPYLDAKELYAEFHLDEPWDSEHNRKLVAKMPAPYRSPASKLRDGRTVYLTPRAPETAFPGATGIQLRDVKDGTTNTIAVIEVSDEQAIPWTKPDDLPINWQTLRTSVANRYLVGQKSGFLFGACDGAAHWLPNDVDETMLKALFTANGRERVNWDKLRGE